MIRTPCSFAIQGPRFVFPGLFAHTLSGPLTLTWFAALLIICATNVLSQTRSFPKEIRGYKVERTVVEVKQPRSVTKARKSGDDEQSGPDSGVDELIQFGEPKLVRATPLGLTLEIPIVVAPIKQSGHADFLLFEDMAVNGTSVEIDEYHRAFDLPNRKPLTLREPLSVYVYVPNAVLAAVADWRKSKETWPVTGRVYVFGKFKKGLFSFKRCVPVELNLTMRNPLREN